MASDRRTFLKVGALAALALAAAGGAYRYANPPGPARRFVLDGEARAALEAIVPAMLAGVLPAGSARAPAIAATSAGVHQAILGLPLGTQQEVQDLFALLALAPVRRVLTGVAGPWSGASEAQVGAFLQDWRFHRLGMLQTAYHALHDLVIGAWYANPSSWDAIGYPGPMKELA